MSSLKATFENFVARAYRVSEVLITGLPSAVNIEESINSFDVDSDTSVGGSTERIENQEILPPLCLGSSISDETTKNILDSSLAARDRLPITINSDGLVPDETPMIGLGIGGSKRLRDDQDDIDLGANESSGPSKHIRSASKSLAFSSTSSDIPSPPIILSLEAKIRIQQEDNKIFKTELSQEIKMSIKRMARISNIALTEQRIRLLKMFPEKIESLPKVEMEFETLLSKGLHDFD